MSDIRLNTHGLDQLIRALRDPNPPRVRVGVLGGKVNRTEQRKSLSFAEVAALSRPIRQGKHLSNAEIGAIHEYGNPAHGMPARSFLRVPLKTKLDHELEASGAFDDQSFSLILRSGSLRPWMKRAAVVAERVVIGAFHSGGYGKWKAWKGSYQSNTGMILLDTTQLMGSITAVVVGGE